MELIWIERVHIQNLVRSVRAIDHSLVREFENKRRICWGGLYMKHELDRGILLERETAHMHKLDFSLLGFWHGVRKFRILIFEVVVEIR